MKRDIKLWQFAGFSLSSLFGTLLHFLYDWTSESVFIAPFSGVNESTWEHMKLLYFPLLIFACIQSRFFEERASFWKIKLVGIAVGLLAIPTLFYTYNGAIGKSPDWVNITIFFVAAAIAFFTEYRLLKQSARSNSRFEWLAFGILCVIGILFIVFTFAPPHIPLFQDPITGVYGI